MNAFDALDGLAIDTIRTLAMDAVQQANSGHPGTPMALAPVIYTLWQRHLRFDPLDPAWPGRDRFVLSCGHASMLLYAPLHLAQVRAGGPGTPGHDRLAVTLDDIRRFRQWGSATPGHPEFRHTAGVETTTGPLGQGVATSVGMTIARDWLAARHDQPGQALFDHHVWVMCSDGDMMEGVSHEAAALAGHLKLAGLTWIYDDNRISIEGPTTLAMSEDVGARFLGYGWHVLRVDDANDLPALDQAFTAASAVRDRPVLVIVRSHIAWGSPHKQDQASAHGEPLGADEVKLTKRAYGWPEDETFRVPDGVRERFAAQLGARGAVARAAWETRRAAHRVAHPDAAVELDRVFAGALPADWERALPSFPADPKGMATRDASGKTLNALAAAIPWLVGGSADLAPSTKTRLGGDAGDLEAGSPGGRNLHFGVREHGMGAIVNGMALGGLRAFGATFLVFSDYMRGAIRLSAIMRLPVVWVFTHDSIGVGEDGPTHQPIEHLAALRALPGLTVWRPADANETAEAWRAALATDGPSALALTRQTLPTLDRTRLAPAAGVTRGGYVLADSPGGPPELILIATGSEVSLCVAAHERLTTDGVRCRVVSLPSWERFAAQDVAYRDTVLPPAVTRRIAVEMAAPFGWERWVGREGTVIAMHGFGASAPFSELQKRFGFTVERIVEEARAALQR
ncbi:MAG: transketolase [Candidatus Eisenbacteria bacterium]